LRDTATTGEKGLLYLYREFADAIAREFVHTTRFDPFHQAASEQELYDRLPGIVTHMQQDPVIMLELNGAAVPYSITLERDLMVRRAEPVYKELLRLIDRMQGKRAEAGKSVLLQVSHRLACLPGCLEMLHTLEDARVVALGRGVGVLGGQKIWHGLAAQDKSRGVSFFTSRPRGPHVQSDAYPRNAGKAAQPAPTHLLYGSIAYPITDAPLMIGSARSSGQNPAAILVEAAGVSARHCTVAMRNGEAVLNDVSGQGTFVDEKRVDGSITLKLGQIIRVGAPGARLQLIACLKGP
jgi:hypothetical protein